MSKVVLSKGYEFDLVANAVTASDSTVGITFIPGEKTVEELEEIWAGNETIKVVIGDDETIRNFESYVKVSSVTKNKNYESGVDDEGNPIYITVVTVVASKVNMETRVSNVEDAVEDIINTIL